MNAATKAPSRIERIKQSWGALPQWVKIWMNFILGPVNLATLAFLNEPSGALIAALALSGMAFTVAIVFVIGGFHKIAAAGHILPWVPLVVLLGFFRPEGSALYGTFLTVLLITNVISLLFDANDIRIAISKPQQK